MKWSNMARWAADWEHPGGKGIVRWHLAVQPEQDGEKAD